MLILFIVIITILLTGFFAGIETGCYTLSRLKLFYKVNKKRKKAVILNSILSEPQKFVFMALVCQNIFVYITSELVTYYFISNGIGGENLHLVFGFFPWSAEIAAALVLLFPLFIFSEAGPKNLFLSHADTLMYKTAGFQRICYKLCKPLICILSFLSKLLPESHDNNSYSFDEMNTHKLKLFFMESRHEGVITRHQNEMINNVIKLSETSVSKIMIPLNKLFALSVDAGPNVWLSEMKKRQNNYSDIPVYSKNKKNILGTVNFFSIIHSAEKEYRSLKSDVKKIIKINSNVNIQQAFSEMQLKKENKALIVDKKNTILGIVYLKDIVSYITMKGSAK